jgi:hypothetical protein
MLKVKKDYLYWFKTGISEGIVSGMLDDKFFPITYYRIVEHQAESVFYKMHPKEKRMNPKHAFVDGFALGYNNCHKLIEPLRNETLKQHLLEKQYIELK